ncbi:MAG: Rrf2 family transcriptional regulator [Gemmatimonadota bacterium]|nr:MAG: Rrf2 family transcriptional regulator [Gemmatimonadota bacterium]
MGKILHELSKAGVLKSSRGKGGGFELALPPHQLSLLTIVSRFNDLGGQRRCLMGRPKCSDHNPCLVHERWKETAEQIAQFSEKPRWLTCWTTTDRSDRAALAQRSPSSRTRGPGLRRAGDSPSTSWTQD